MKNDWQPDHNRRLTRSRTRLQINLFIIDEGDNSLMTFLKGSWGLPVEDITNHLTQPC